MTTFNIIDFIFSFEENEDYLEGLFLGKYAEDIQEKRISWEDYKLQTVKFITEFRLSQSGLEEKSRFFILYPLAKELYDLWSHNSQLEGTKTPGP